MKKDINNFYRFDDSNDNIIRKWLAYNNFSCRYHTFFCIYIFIIKSEINSSNNEDNINLYNLISDDILNTTISWLKAGIWNILNRYKNNYDFLSISFKEKNTIFQLFNPLEKN